jgi:PKD repeat protein
MNAGGNLNPAVLPGHNVTLQYVKHGLTEARPSDSVFDIGAFEFGSPTGGNQPPVAGFTATPASGFEPLTVTFNSAGSYDPDGTISGYAWEFGDGATATGPSTTHAYNAAGTFTVLVRVTDNAGATASATRSITVSPLPAPVLTGSVSGTTINLSWTDASHSLTGYRVERRRNNGSWNFMANVTARAFSETRPNGTWRYRVRSFNSVAVSPWSNTVTLRIGN